jgi:exosortase C (VPDSG-CTERM-specific)
MTIGNTSIPSAPPSARTGQWRRFVVAVSVLVLCFGMPLAGLVKFAAVSNLYSYIILIPFISAYLIWLKRAQLPAASRQARITGGIFSAAGLVLLAVYWLVLRPGLKQREDDYLALMMVAFLLIFTGVCFWFWGREKVRAMSFPLAFLVFMVPIPGHVLARVDTFLQYGSALMAHCFFKITGMTFYQDSLTFQLPDIVLRIAPECSGIHSSIVLLITSLLAAYLLLKTPWKRAVLVLVVIPLALIRNGFRVFVLGELCVHISPRMIDSPIHHQGGPIFFVLSLIPFFLLLMVLQKSEPASKQKKTD